MATNKTSRGYTKSKIDPMKVFLDMNKILKSPDEPTDKWIIRKSEESFYGGTDEQGVNRKEDVQNPNPS